MSQKTNDAVVSFAAVADLISRHPAEYEALLQDRREKMLTPGGKVRTVKDAVSAARKTGGQPEIPQPRTRARRVNVPVNDKNGRELEAGQRVLTPKGEIAEVVRFNRSQKRAVVRHQDDSLKMVTGHRLIIVDEA